jgi:CubicO group peptidase (beta-lactamase class C family)
VNTLLARRDVLRLGAALALGACTPRILRADDRDDRFDWRLHEPEDAGMSRAGLETIRAAVQKYVDNEAIPGAVTAIARHNKLVWFEAQGARDPEAGTPMAKDDIFRMMSSSKPVTAVAVLMMMDEGKLALDDPVGRFIPTFKDTKVAVAEPGARDASQVKLVPADRDVTIKDLLTHTSGLASTGDLIVLRPPGSVVNTLEVKPDETLADVIPRLGSTALDFQPGTKWRYSPLVGFDTLLRIVEVASGKSADEFLRERLFEPLDMRDTSFNVPAAKKARLVNIYARRFGRWEVGKHLFGDGPYKYLSGSGGLFSNVRDFMRFEAMLLNKGSLNGHRVLRPETVALMATNHVGELFDKWLPLLSRGEGFGLGVAIVQDAARGGGRGVGAFGWGGAYGTESWVDPELDVAAAVFLQLDVAAAVFLQLGSGPGNLRTDFQQALRKAIVSGPPAGR